MVIFVLIELSPIYMPNIKVIARILMKNCRYKINAPNTKIYHIAIAYEKIARSLRPYQVHASKKNLGRIDFRVSTVFFTHRNWFSIHCNPAQILNLNRSASCDSASLLG